MFILVSKLREISEYVYTYMFQEKERGCNGRGCLESSNGSETASSPSSPPFLDISMTPDPLQQAQQEEEEEEGKQSILDFFKQHQDPQNSDSWVVNDLEDFGQVFNDFNRYDYDFNAYGAEDYYYGVKGVVPSPCGDAYASLTSFTESICSSLKALAV